MSSLKKTLNEVFHYIVARINKKNTWPAYKKRYDFTEDWFTYWVPTWKIVLSPFRSKPNIKALEIGTFEGRSALWLLENILTHPTSEIFCIDPYDGDIKLTAVMNRFISNLIVGNFRNRVRLFNDKSHNVLPEINHKFDIIYIDGNHAGEEILRDAESCWPMLNVNGILIFDDYEWPRNIKQGRPPQEAIEEFLKARESHLQILHKGYQLVVKRIS